MPPQHSRASFSTRLRCQVAPALRPLDTTCTRLPASAPPCAARQGDEHGRSDRREAVRGVGHREAEGKGGGCRSRLNPTRNRPGTTLRPPPRPAPPAPPPPHLDNQLLELQHGEVQGVGGGEACEEAALLREVVEHQARAKLQAQGFWAHRQGEEAAEGVCNLDLQGFRGAARASRLLSPSIRPPAAIPLTHTTPPLTPPPAGGGTSTEWRW